MPLGFTITHYLQYNSVVQLNRTYRTGIREIVAEMHVLYFQAPEKCPIKQEITYKHFSCFVNLQTIVPLNDRFTRIAPIY